MRVAHLTTVDSTLRYLLLEQLRAVAAGGGEAVGISAPGPFVAELTAEGFGHRPLGAATRGMNPWSDLRAAWQLWRILRHEHFDVLHTHNPKPGIYGRVVGRLAAVPIVVHTTHGLYATEDDPWARRAAVYLLEAIAARCSDAELVQNEEDLELMRRLHISPSGRSSLLGNGIDLSRFDPDRFDAASRAEVRRRLDVGAGQVLVGSVGRLVGEKGYAELFEAMADLGPGYVLVVAGPEDLDKADALAPALLTTAAARGVRFLGLRDDMDALYSAMDLFVLASHREGLPRAAIEATAMAVPVVTTNIRGCRQVVVDGVNGLVVPVADPPALTAAIRRLGEDAELRRALGHAGRARACRLFDERRVVATVMETYRGVADRKGLAWTPDPAN